MKGSAAHDSPLFDAQPVRVHRPMIKMRCYQVANLGETQETRLFLQSPPPLRTMVLFLALIGLVSPAAAYVLTSTSFNRTAWEAQPYVANGYIGQRIPAEGMGYYEIPPINESADDGTSGWPLFDRRFTAAMVAGFYDQQATTSGTNFDQTGGEQPISTLPTWSSLYITVDGATYQVGTDTAQISNYQQSLSIQNGIVSTSFKWSPATNVSMTLNYTVIAHRVVPNLGVVRLDVTGLKAGVNVTITSVLDGAGSWRTTTPNAGVGIVPNTPDTVYSAVQPDGIANVTAYEVSRVVFATGKGTALPRGTGGCFTGLSSNASTISQCYSGSPSSTGTLSVVKYVGIASSDAYAGKELSTALGAVTHAVSAGYNSVLKEHTDAWDALWEDADVIISGTGIFEELQYAARASLFHLLSNVRQGSEGHGLGDNSIAPAGLTSDSYAGQIFWDADTWMFPGLNALFPLYAESITNFRYRQLGAAQENAKLFNVSGSLYPWTAGRFGNCTGVGPCYNYEYHLENDISLAQYQYWASSQNRTWLETKGWPVISSIAEFWASQVTFNSSTGKYSTLNETDPDEYANFRNNAAFTNAGISVVLKNAVYFAGVLGITPPSNWTTISNKITVLSDPTSGIVLEYDGFNSTTDVKQADVVLLTYPLEYPQTTAQGLADLDYYALATSPNGPGMTYSVFSIDASALSPVGCASYTYLLSSSQPYSRAPFYQFSEQTSDVYTSNGGTNPAYTFLTAHGGFLQSLTHGFTGYRSRTNAFYLDPILPDQISNYTVKGMKYRSGTFDVTLTTSQTIIRLRSTSGGASIPVEIASANARAGNYTLKAGQSLVVPTRHTNGTLVEGNLAQCKSILAPEVSFTNTSPSVIPGQYALAAIDGSNATSWQPYTNSSQFMVVDLQTLQTVSALHFNWGGNPPISYSVTAGASTMSMAAIASGNVTLSAPTVPDTITVNVGNVTDVKLASSVKARYVNVTITGSFAADGRGGTVAEFAVI
ncbi:alpha,alpha-trehalase ath1 [Tulasnella sp. JGI-2019a]|nr:alpha,alpha-trehalase ath1 [Tulasnella sp. JGI-2019a]KAG9031134.1 alpha,alpha-trehalase ath1 [Tulasnella sp. JGI-2019a]